MLTFQKKSLRIPKKSHLNKLYAKFSQHEYFDNMGFNIIIFLQILQALCLAVRHHHSVTNRILTWRGEHYMNAYTDSAPRHYITIHPVQ